MTQKSMTQYMMRMGNTGILNRKETTLAQQKQELIREEFKEWIFKDMSRRETLCKIYNERFNSIRPREYDGSHIQFVGMNPEIKLMEHQKNAVAHIFMEIIPCLHTV